MPVSKERAMEMFDHDLTFFMNDIRRLLAHYRIGDWEAYLFFRKPDCPQSYVLKYEATAGDGFAKQIVALHAQVDGPQTKGDEDGRRNSSDVSTMARDESEGLGSAARGG